MQMCSNTNGYVGAYVMFMHVPLLICCTCPALREKGVGRGGRGRGREIKTCSAFVDSKGANQVRERVGWVEGKEREGER